MSTTVDQRVVEMRFDNQQFEAGVRTSMSTLDKLKESLNFEGCVQGLDGFNKTINNLDFSAANEGIEAIRVKISALDIVAATVISRITNAVINGVNKIGQATIGQIITGGKTRALNILNAKFMIKGLGKEWSDVEKQVNYGVAGTAYSLDAAAKAASQLLASGVEINNKFDEDAGVIDDMGRALRAISGVAAMTNSDYESIADIFTTIAGNGKVMTMQLRQLSARGLNAAAVLKEALHTTEAGVYEMVSKGQVDFATFSNAMDSAFGQHAKDANETFSGAMSNVRAALSKIGEKFATPIYENMVGPLNAIRETINNVKEVIGPLAKAFNNFAINSGKIVTSFFQKIRDGIAIVDDEGKTVIVSEFGKWLTTAEGSVGGLNDVLTIVSNTINGIKDVISVIWRAYKTVFPPKTAEQLKEVSGALADFSTQLRPSKETLSNIGTVFLGVFSILKVGITIIKSLLKVLKPVILALRDILSFGFSITSILGNIIHELTSVIFSSETIEKVIGVLKLALEGIEYVLRGLTLLISRFVHSNGLTEFFNALISVAKEALRVVSSVISGIVKILVILITTVTNFTLFLLNVVTKVLDGIADAIGNITRRMKELASQGVQPFIAFFQSLLEAVISGIQRINNGLKTTFEAIKNSKIGKLITDIKNKLKELFGVVDDGTGKFDIKQFFLNIVDGIKRAANAFKEFIEDGKLLAKIFSLVYASIFAVFAVQLVRLTSNVSALMLSLSSLANTINALLKGISLGTRKPKSKITELAEAVTLLTIDLMILAKVAEGGQINNAVKSLWHIVGMVLALEVVGAAVSAVYKKLTKDDYVADFGKTIIGLSVGIFALVAAFKVLEQVDFSNMEDKLWVMTVMVGLIVSSIIAINRLGTVVLKEGESSRITVTAFRIFALGFALKQLAAAFVEISNMSVAENTKDNLENFTQIVVAIAVLALAARSMNLGGVIGVVVLIKMVSGLIPEIEQISQAPFHAFVENMAEFNKMVYAMLAVTLALGIFGSLFGREIDGFGKALLSFAVSTAIIVGVCLAVSKAMDELGRCKTKTAAGIVAGMAIVTGIVFWLTKLKTISKTVDNMHQVGETVNHKIETTTESFATAITKAVIHFAVAIGLLSFISVKLREATQDWGFEDYLRGLIPTIVLMLAMAATLRIATKNMGDIKFGTILSFIIGLTEVIAAVAIFTFFPADELFKSVAALSITMLALGKLLNDVKNLAYAKEGIGTIKAINLLLIALGATIAFLSTEFTDTNKTLIATVSLTAVMFMLNKFVKTLAANATLYPENLIKTINAVTLLVLSMGACIAGINAASKDNLQAIVATGSLTGVMIALSFLMKTISGASGLGNEKTAEHKQKTILAITALIGAIGACLAAITALSRNNFQAVLSASASISLVLLVLIDSVKKISDIKVKDIQKLYPIFTLMIGMIGMIGFVLNFLGTLNKATGQVETTLAAAASVSMVLFTMAQMLKTLSNIDMDAAAATKIIAAIGSACGAVLVIGFALEGLGSFDWKSMLSAAGSISAVLLATTTMLAVLAKLDIKISEGVAILISLIGICGLIVSFGFAMKLMQSFDWNNTTNMLIGLIGTMGAMLGVMFALKKMQNDIMDAVNAAASLAVMIVSLIGFAVACDKLAEVKWDLLSSGLGTFVIVMATIGTIMAMAAAFGPAGSAAMFLMAVAIGVISIAIIGVCNSLSQLIISISTASNYFEAFKDTVDYLLSINFEGLSTTLSLLSASLNDFTENINYNYLAMQEAVMFIGNAAELLLKEYTIFKNHLAIVFVNLTSQINQNGILLKDEGTKVGRNILEGVLIGLQDDVNRKALAAEMVRVAKEMLASVKEELGIHSPSTRFRDEVGKNSVLGMAEGTRDPMAVKELKTNLKLTAEEAIGETSVVVAEDGQLTGEVFDDATAAGALENADTVTDAVTDVVDESGAEASNDMASNGLTAGHTFTTATGAEIINSAKNLLNPLLEVGKSLGNALVKGLDYGLHAISGTLITNYADLFATLGLIEQSTADSFHESYEEEMSTYEAELTSAIDGVVSTLNDNMDTIQTSFLDLKSMVTGDTKDWNLFGVDEDSIEEQAQNMTETMAEAMSGITTSMGDGGKAVDEFGQKLSNLHDTIDKQIDAWKEFDKSVDISSEDILRNLQSQISGVNEWSNKILVLAQRGISKGILEELANMGPQGFKYVEAFIQMTGDELATVNDLWVEKGTLSTSSTLAIQAAYALAGDQASMAYVTGLGMNLDQVQKAAQQLGDSLAFEISPEALKAIDVYKEQFNSLYDSIESSINIFEAFNMETETTSDEMLENMRSQIEGITKWSENLRILGERGISDGLLKELSALGPDGYDKVNAFVEMTKSQLQEANDLYAQSLELPASATANVLSGYAQAGDDSAKAFIEALGASVSNVNQIGTYILEGLQAGLFDSEATANLTTTAYGVGDSIIEQLMKSTDSHSPSLRAEEIGVWVDMGLRNGLDKASVLPTQACTQMAEYMMQGLINGISSGSARVVDAMVNVCMEAKAAAERALKIESPSKVFAQIGKYTVMGFSEGIDKNAQMVANSTEEMGNASINTLKDALTHAKDLIDGNIDNTITLTPVLDLSNVRAGVQQINGMMNSASVSANTTVDGSDESGKNQNGGMTFIQNNYSPKALNRIDIYRQTKNQFAAMKGLVSGT